MDIGEFESSFPANNISNIYLSNAFCSGIRTRDVITFNYTYAECNTRHKEKKDNDIFSNYLVEYEVDPITCIPDRVLWRYDVTCVRPRHETDSIAFSPVDNTTGIHVTSSSMVKGHMAKISFFSESGFTNEIVGNPLKVNVGSRVYVQVESTAVDDVKLVVENCYVSPGSSANDHGAVSLIKNRCESNKFVHILGAVDKITQFYFDVFEIPHHKESIFVNCDVSFCDLMDFTNKCQHGCQKANP